MSDFGLYFFKSMISDYKHEEVAMFFIAYFYYE